jgi:hypothetical protein
MLSYAPAQFKVNKFKKKTTRMDCIRSAKLPLALEVPYSAVSKQHVHPYFA